ncbi:MAG: hypothetical protein ACI4MJ_01595 [Aristaeellaceae bacterium]
MSEIDIIDAMRMMGERQKRFSDHRYAQRYIPVLGEAAHTHADLAEGTVLRMQDKGLYPLDGVYLFDAPNLAVNGFQVSSPSRGFTFEYADGEWTISGAASGNNSSLNLVDTNGSYRFSVSDHGWQAGDVVHFYAFARAAVATDAKLRMECRNAAGSTVKKDNVALCSTSNIASITYTIADDVVDMTFMLFCSTAGMEINNTFTLGLFVTPNAPAIIPLGEDATTSGGTVTTMPLMSCVLENMDIIDYIGTHGSSDVSLSFLTPEDFGARGDGTGDDTEAVNACLVQAAANKVSVRGYGRYKCAGTVAISGSDMDIFLNRIESAATDVCAVEIRDLKDSQLRFAQIRYSGTVAAVVFAGSSVRYTLSALGIASTKGHAILVSDDCTAMGRSHITCHRIYAEKTALMGIAGSPTWYTDISIDDMTSVSGDCVSGFAECNFHGVHWTCPNGFLANDCDCCKFYHICVEHEVAGGYQNIRLCTIFYGRTIEFMDRTSQESYFGALIKLVGANYGNHIYYTHVALPNIDVSEMFNREQLIAYRNSEEVIADTGRRSRIHHPNVIHARIENCTYWQWYVSDRPQTQPNHGSTTMGYQCLVHLGRKIVTPASYYVQDVTGDLDMRDYTYPFIPQELVINGSGVVTLGDSYCSMGVHMLTVRQEDTGVVTLRDRDETVIFDGGEAGPGVYRITWVAQPEILNEESTVMCNMLNDLVRVEKIS